MDGLFGTESVAVAQTFLPLKTGLCMFVLECRHLITDECGL